MLSISTSWNTSKETNWEIWLNEIQSLGLNAIELSYTLSRDQYETIAKLIKPLNIKVSSIHNFCPTPDDEPSPRHVSNYYRLSSLDDHERKQAVKWTKICIDTAKHVGAAVVVLHAGTLEWDNSPAERMIKYLKEGQIDSPEVPKLREEFIKERKVRSRPYLAALEASFSDVMIYAQKNNIKVGLETRYYPIEIPNFEEVEYFLNKFETYGMSYWHDVGHAQVNERLGLSSHKAFFEKYGSRMIGVHLHGIRVARDHLAPFDGDWDLNSVLGFIKPHHYKVIEARFATPEQIKFAVDTLKKI
jgi:sugar phosphate isomerase/epimerase